MHTHDLTTFNTLALTTVAPCLLRYRATSQLPDLMEQIARCERVFVLGGGSNVVLAPTLSCTVIKVESKGVRLLSESSSYRIIEAEAGESWHDFVTYCLQQGWQGLENLALIPGTVGAAPVQNIGAYGVELDQRLHSVLAWDLVQARMVELSPEECGFSYRSSIFKQAQAGRWLILKVRFCLPRNWTPVLTYADLRQDAALVALGSQITAQDIYRAVCEIRRRKLPDPDVLANAGSFFKNPVISAAAFVDLKKQWPDVIAYAQSDGRWKLAAGWLIEQVGWKGQRLGRVGMHERQALVLVNYGGACAEDVLALAQRVCSDVKQRFGVSLEQEPVLVR